MENGIMSLLQRDFTQSRSPAL